MMQVRWGSHGDYAIIALCPNSPQECFDLTIKAFNYSEKYRCPVFVMLDEVVGHMTEKVVIPRARGDRSRAAPLHDIAARNFLRISRATTWFPTCRTSAKATTCT